MSMRARLLGLALRRAPPPEPLLIPRCRSVHTFGMRFALDLYWLGAEAQLLRVDWRVRPWRLRSCRGAAAVLEVAHGMMPAVNAEGGHEATEPQTPPEEMRGRVRAGFDPRQRIYRDRFNEYFVLVLSAAGAAVVAPVLLYVVMALTGLWTALTFVIAAVILELLLIFVVGRPQMAPRERVGWALLWGFTTAVLALCFFHLVASSTL